MSRKFTIYDLARDLGLSVATTSKAFNDYSDISEKTRERVQRRAKELDFEPSMAAKSNTTKQSYLLGVMYSEISEGLMHPHFSEILEYFRQHIERYGYQLMLIGENDRTNRRTLLQTCKFRGVDGLLVMAYDRTNPELLEVLQSSLPVVLVDFEMPNCSSVVSDNIGGMEKLIDYCYQRGHRDFCYISADLSVQSAAERLTAARARLQHYGLSLPDSHVAFTQNHSFDAGYFAMEELLEKQVKATIVIAAYDLFAYGAISCLHTHQISIPNDMSVTGFDDLPTIRLLPYQLTTVRQERKQIGERAAEILLEQVQAGERKVINVRLDTPLIVRSSVLTLNVATQ